MHLITGAVLPLLPTLDRRCGCRKHLHIRVEKDVVRSRTGQIHSAFVQRRGAVELLSSSALLFRLLYLVLRRGGKLQVFRVEPKDDSPSQIGASFPQFSM